MTINNSYQPNFTAIALGDTIYKLESIDGKQLSVFKGKIGVRFEEIPIDGDRPGNRDMYSLTAIDQESFILSGGISTEIDEFDMWRFHIPTRKWTKLKNSGDRVPCRKGHSSILWYYAGCSRLYVIGGASFVYIRRDIICIELENDTFRATTIPLDDDDLPPRLFCSLSLIQNRIRVFGGIDENGKILGDMWDLSATYHNPAVIWTPVKSNEKMARYNHIAYVIREDADHYLVHVVGGIGRNGPVNNIAMLYGQPWEIKNIYDAVDPVIYSDMGLVEVCDPPQLVELKSIYTQLDLLFDDLRHKQSLYKQALELKQYLRDQWKEEQNLMSQPFSEEFFNQVLNSKAQDRADLMDEMDEALRYLTNFSFASRDSNDNGIKSILCYFEYELKKKKRIHEAKYDLLKKEIEISTERLNKMPQAELIKYDTGNFDSIWKIIEPMNNADRSAVLDQFITRQLLDLAELRDKCSRYKQKKHKDMQTCIKLISKTAESASETLTESKKSFQRWNDRLDALQKDLLDAQSFARSLSKAIDKNVFTRLYEARWKLRDELEKLCDKSADLLDLYEKVRKLRADETREGRTAIISAMPELLAIAKNIN